MAARLTKAEVANIIEHFVDGTGGGWDWDDFTSVRIEDPELDAIRQRCCDLQAPTVPANVIGLRSPKVNTYCGPEGFDEMRRMVTVLRSSD